MITSKALFPKKPNMNHGIYLDNNTTTPMSNLAISKMLPFLTDMWGVSSAPHSMGQQLFPAIEENLKAIYALVGANEKQHFVFTSSGAEAINQAIFSTYFDVTRLTGKNHFITSQIDEAPSIMSIGRLEQLGCIGKMVEPDKEGRITPDILSEAISPRTAMISLSWANGLTGVINPVKEIAELCKSRGICLHLDATHVLGKLFYDLDEIGADMITFNGDQIHGPKGSGGLFYREGMKCSPLIVGGLEQAGGRAGAINMPALAALGQAAREMVENRDLICTETARLRDLLEAGILSEYPEAQVLFKEQERLPNCTTIVFPGIFNEALLYALNRKLIFANIGGGSFQQIGLVLRACGVPDILANSAVSFGLSRETSADQIERAVAMISEIASKLRKATAQLV